MLAVNICVVSLVGDSPPCEFLSILKKVLKIGIAFICVRNSLFVPSFVSPYLYCRILSGTPN